MNSLVQDNMRGLIISQRPDEVYASKINKAQPFSSTFPINSPTGYNPTVKFKIIHQKAPDNTVHKRNRRIITNIQKIKNLEKEIMSDEEVSSKRKLEKIRLNALKQNKMLRDIKNEVHHEMMMRDNNLEQNNLAQSQVIHNHNPSAILPKIRSKPDDEDIILDFFNPNSDAVVQTNYDNHNKNNDMYKKSNLPKLDNVKKPKWAMTKEEAEDIDDAEQEKLILFAQNLDYDKYVKDMEVREALYLIKNKIESGNENEFKVEKKEGNEEEMTDEEEGNGIGIGNEGDGERNPNFKSKQEKLENDHPERLKTELMKTKPFETELHWNQSNKVGEDEYPKEIEAEKFKKTIAEDVLKKNINLKAVHSVQSIKKLLEREGYLTADGFHKREPIVSVIKGREGMHKYPDRSGHLPFLHEYPVV